MDTFVYHLLSALGVDFSHLFHSDKESLHEDLIVTVGPWDVIEVQTNPRHDICSAWSTRVYLHALAVAPDELSCHMCPVVVVIYSIPDLL